MKVSRWLLPLAAAPLVLVGCDSFGQAMTAHTDVVARAAGHELRVEEAAQMLAANPEIPADPEVVRTLANLWVDYTLLATAVAEDTSLAAINLDHFTQPAREQMLVMKLRDRVIQADTLITDEQLQQRWAADGPEAQIRARHILLRIPSDATPAQRDSVRQQAESLRQRAVGGEDFPALAQQYSQDPGTAQRGGDLDYFGRGRMVAPFEEAAFALEPGQVSPVVESPFGFHVIRVEDRRQPEIGEQREDFRRFLIQQAEQQAETAYLDSLATAANVTVRPNAAEVVREISAQPDLPRRGRAAQRVLASYRSGDYTTGEFADFIRMQPPHVQNAFSTATNEQLEGVIDQLARKEVLLEEAAAHGLAITPAEQDSIRLEARQAIRELLDMSGFGRMQQGASAAAVQAEVRELIEGAIRGERQLVPLGTLSFTLRDAYPAEVNPATFTQVIGALERLRPQQPQPQPGMPGEPGMPGTPGDPPQPMPEHTPVPPQEDTP